METANNTILTAETIRMKIRRMAYEIYENNTEEKEIILAGIIDRGNILAEKLKVILDEIADFDIKIIELELNKPAPSEVKLSAKMDFNNKVIIVVDDVANSGRTLLFAMKPFLEFLPKKIETAVLVDRQHKRFPMRSDYVGYSLSTTLQDIIMVSIEDGELVSAYLE